MVISLRTLRYEVAGAHMIVSVLAALGFRGADGSVNAADRRVAETVGVGGHHGGFREAVGLHPANMDLLGGPRCDDFGGGLFDRPCHPGGSRTSARHSTTSCRQAAVPGCCSPASPERSLACSPTAAFGHSGDPLAARTPQAETPAP